MLEAIKKAAQNTFVNSTPRQPADKDEESYQFLSDSLSRVSEWVRFADAKAGGVLAILALLLADALDKAGTLWRAYNLDHLLGDVSTIAFWLALGAAVCTVALVSRALFPRIKSTTSSKAFFGDVARHENYEEYSAAVAEANAQEEIAKQVWEVSRIAAAKFTTLRYAYATAVTFLVLYVISRMSHWVAT